MLRRLAKTAVGGGLCALTVGTIALAIDAPIADFSDNKKQDSLYIYKRKENQFPEWLHDIPRFPIIFLGVLVSKITIYGLNSTNVEGSEHLLKALDNRPSKTTSVITVSNHTSTIDDPMIIGSVTPWKYVSSKGCRWSLCSQEYCYAKSRLIATFFFGAKTLPIKRGAGIDHEMLQGLFEKVQQGSWIHIFPEGKINQSEALGGRNSPRREELGRLKWGVGKLIARATERPIVIPIYHVNMQNVMPQNGRRLVRSIPTLDQNIHIVVGPPVQFDDIFEMFEKHEHGEVKGNEWKSLEEEKALYSAIASRIEEALLALEASLPEEERRNGEQEDFHHF